MIIGISGKKQHGKDTVAKIIQYLIHNDQYPTDNITIDQFLAGQDDYYEVGHIGDIDYTISERCGWKKKQFAEKLKQIVCLMIGCTMEELEDNDFKETPLGIEWLYWEGMGVKGEKYLFATNDEAIESKFKKNLSSFSGPYRHTPRTLLQLIGTDCGRKIIHPNIWINALMAEYKPIAGYQSSNTSIIVPGTSQSMEIPDTAVDRRIWPNWIITDVRFPNEVEAIKAKDGIVLRVNRDMRYLLCDKCNADDIKPYEIGDEDTCPRCNYKSEGNLTLVIPDSDKHESETALDNYTEWDGTILNQDIQSLVGQIHNYLHYYKIINNDRNKS